MLCLSVYVCCASSTHSGQKKVLKPLKLELQRLKAMQEPGTKPRFSAKAASALKCWAISPAPLKCLLKLDFEYKI